MWRQVERQEAIKLAVSKGCDAIDASMVYTNFIKRYGHKPTITEWTVVVNTGQVATEEHYKKVAYPTFVRNTYKKEMATSEW